MSPSQLPIRVIKIGTNTLTTEQGSLDLNNLRHLVTQLAAAYHENKFQFLVVTSGAITCGAEVLHTLPKTIPDKQAAASVGQILLMSEYGRFFGQFGIRVGQILLTKDCIEDSIKRKNTQNTIFNLLKHGVVPVINENDSVATDEIGPKFGDNDELSCYVAQLVEAEQLVLLTDTDGVFTHNPKTHKEAVLIPELKGVSQALLDSVEDIQNGRSRGGMTSKLNAAKRASESGIEVVIANGRTDEVLRTIFSGKPIGTRINLA